MPLQNPHFLKKLEKAGLSEKEALVYLAVLELGGAYPSKIAEYTQLNRSTVYKILLDLSIRGIINEIEKKNKLFYQVERPERFIKYSENKVRQAEESLEIAKSILPAINDLRLAVNHKVKITYYEGVEGITTIYEDHLATKKPYEMLAWVDTSELQEFLPRAFLDTYIKTKERIGITTRGITTDTQEGHQFNKNRYGNTKKDVWPDIRFASKTQFPMAGEIVVYGINKVSIVNFSKTQAVGVIIEDENIHNMLTTIFNLSWTSSALKR